MKIQQKVSMVNGFIICVIMMLSLLITSIYVWRLSPYRYPKISKSPYRHPQFSKENLCVYFSSLDNEISASRRHNLIKELNNIGVDFHNDKGVTTGSNVERMFYHLLRKMERFKHSSYVYGLICDDDFLPCNDFWEKLNTTMMYVKPRFRCLHLCPGCLWGRQFRDKNKIGHLNRETDLFGIKHDEYVFGEIDKSVWVEKNMWLGGPVAFIVNKESIESLIHEYTSFWIEHKVPNDVILLKIINNNDYVCREPQLGYENEQGGSTFI